MRFPRFSFVIRTTGFFNSTAGRANAAAAVTGERRGIHNQEYMNTHDWKIRARVKSALAFSIAMLAFASTISFGAEEAARRPNILFAFADDWGYPHASAYGDETVRTPNFDQVAREGVLFTHAFVSSPSCTPSRAAVLTGQDFWRLGESANLHSTLDKEIPVYPDLLQAAGYHVGFTRKGWGPGKVERGGRSQNPAGPKFRDFEEFLSKRPADAPFCFWFGSIDPHRPYDSALREELGVDPDAVKVPPVFPDVPAVREDIADYYAEVQRFDREVGEILERLRELGELDNTIIVISGDHGMPFPRYKGNLYDSGTRVPLVIRWSGRIPGGREVTDLVNLTALAPTLLETAGVAVPDAMTGRSLVEVLRSPKEGRVDPARDRVFVGRERHTPAQEAPLSGGYPMRSVRTDDFLYIVNLEPDRWPAGNPDPATTFMEDGWLGDVDNGPTKFYLWANRNDPKIKPLYDLSFARRPPEELYDLRADPDQTRNVAENSEYAAEKVRLRRELMEELLRTSDPRAKGAGEAFDNYPYTGKIPPWPGDDVIEEYREHAE